ncbi:hypothetical protein B5M42_012330 [Paenibacillus athensensis]|uniref:YfjL-like N-terminal domain-containing protein n=1 Tax=Paenibacillus athensensis TaxID=1967502 RepID=A0A4Y8Q7C1_9BACL|nr:hypothetical protein [Paenibacillus athensensis]MCD1259619.1 hypothetical protein [Paenibacillus athensensis]
MIRIKIISILAVASSVIVFVFALNCSLYGTPREKEEFQNRVSTFLKQKYPEINITTNSVSYSFKEMNYYSTVTTGSGLTIHTTTYNDVLEDDYYVALWEQRLTDNFQDYLQRNSLLTPNVRVTINASNKEMEKYKNYTSYSEFSKEISDKTTAYLSFVQPLETNGAILQQCSQVIQWIKMENYNLNLTFVFGDNTVRGISNADMSSIATLQDVKEQLVK